MAPRSAHRTTPLAASKASLVGGPPARGGAAPLLDQEAQAEEGVDPLGHGGAGQARRAGQLGAAGGLAVAHQLEQGARREDVGADVPREAMRGS